MKRAIWFGVMVMTCLAVAGTAMASDNAQKPRQRAQGKVDRQFKALDANHDVGISRSEWKGRPQAFDRLDANKDNVLSLQELQRGIRKAAGRRARKT